jgi:Predicted permease
MQKRKIILYIVIILILAFAAFFFYKYQDKISRIATPFLLGVPIAYIVKPLADKLERRKIPKVPAILSVYLFIILAVVAIGIFLIPELTGNIRELMNTLPELMSGYQNILDGFIKALKTSKWSEEFKTVVFNEMQNGITAMQGFFAGLLKKSLAALVDTVKMIFDFSVGMVIGYYFIKDSKHFKELFLSFLPRRYRNGLTSLGKEINVVLAGFIQGQLLTALIVGAMETVGLILVGVKYPLVLGMIGGLANIIPYFGPYIGAIPAVAIALTQSPVKVLWAVVVFIVVQQIDNSYISPKMIEGKLGLHPVATIFAVLVGGEFFGIIGMLIAVPVFAILRIIIRQSVDAIA